MRAGELPVGDDWGKEPEDIHGLLHTDTVRAKYPSLKGDYHLYYNNLYESIVNRAPVKEKPEHGFNTIRVMELAQESHLKQCTIECTGLLPVY